MSENGIKKRKKHLEKIQDDEGGFKKKRKYENGVEKPQPDNEKRVKRKTEADGERIKKKIKPDGEKKKENRKEGSELKKTEDKKEKKKAVPKAPQKSKDDGEKVGKTIAPKKNKDDGEKDEKTMDYKKFHLLKMKDKWKNGKAKTKRKRDRKVAKTGISDDSTKSKEKKREGQKKEEKRFPAAVEDFGPCDISELVHYWNLFASSNLTAVEREELSLPPDNVVANTNGRKPSSFFTKRIPKWEDWLNKKIPNGSPQIIVLCPSGLRAADLNRDLAPFKSEKCRVAKLFRKEKAKEQGDRLKKTAVNMVIGTPHRIDLLLSHGTLKLGECRVIALDWSFEDQKKRRLITIPELQVDLFQSFRKYFIPLLKNKNVTLMLF